MIQGICNSDLVFFLPRGKSDSGARITQSVLIKQWERVGIPWGADNGASGVFLLYPEQLALGNQVQLSSATHRLLFDKHLAREEPVLIKGCRLV